VETFFEESLVTINSDPNRDTNKLEYDYVCMRRISKVNSFYTDLIKCYKPGDSRLPVAGLLLRVLYSKTIMLWNQGKSNNQNICYSNKGIRIYYYVRI